MANILLCVTGSVAATVFPKVRTELLQYGNVKTVMTESAQKIYKAAVGDFRAIPDIYTDEDEWKWKKIGDPILHIDLRDWADILVIAPLTANTLAKISHGFSDNLVTSIFRAWPTFKTWPVANFKDKKPIVLAPAMNTYMYENSDTTSQLESLRNKRLYTINLTQVHIVYPVSKKLACGQTGLGAMAHAKDIGEKVKTLAEEVNTKTVSDIIK